MKLGDLEFKSEDFEPAGYMVEDLILPNGIEIVCFSPKKCAELANRLLSERLEKAPPIYGRKNGISITWSHPRPWKDFGDFIGRLVGVELLKSVK